MRPVNPYIVGNPIKEKAGFFGRQDIFRDVMQILRQRGSNAIVLYGQRRIGKTSVLLQLEKRLTHEGEFTPVYFDLQDKAAKSLPEVLYELSQHISRVTGHTVAQPADFSRTGDYFRSTFLPQISEKAASGGLVLLFDEFDVLDSPMRTQASEAFFPYLRQWMTDLQKVKFVFVIGRRPEDLSVRTMSTFKGIQSTRVSFLKEKDAWEVVRQSEQDGSLKWDESAVQRVIELSHGHPYFTQLLCSVVWEDAYETGPESTPTVLAQNVDDAVSQALKFGANAFNWIWDGLPPAERVVVAAMAEINDEVITQDKLIETLNQSGVRLVARELEFAPETLIDWEVLIESDGGYRFAVPLLRRWVLANRPLRRVKDELDRINPLAETLYQAGRGLYEDGKVDDAEQPLRQALNNNPNHLKARLLLGQILLEKGRLVDSVDMFDAAYQYDERAARADFIKSLLALANTQEENLQIVTYERILKIQGEQIEAKDKLRAIWVKRGEAALAQENFDDAIKAFEQIGEKDKIRSIWLKRGEAALTRENFDDAIKAFEQIGDAEGVEKVRLALREKQLAAEMQRAVEFEKSGQWKSALGVYVELESVYPDIKMVGKSLENARLQWLDQSLRALEAPESEENWEKALEICAALEKDFPEDTEIKSHAEHARAQLDALQKYQQGLGALENGQNDQARQMFSQVLAENPRHLDAARKLIEATYGKIKITRPVPWGAWVPVGITSLLWILLGALAANGLLWNLFAVRVFNSLRGSDSYGKVALEGIILVVVMLIALTSTVVTLWARRALEAVFQLEKKGKPSLWRAFWTHFPFGLGLFYIGPTAWRRWVYPLFALMLPIALIVSPLLIGQPFENVVKYNPQLIKYYQSGKDLIGEIHQASSGQEESWNLVVVVAGGLYLLSFLDVLVTGYLRRGKSVGLRENIQKTSQPKPLVAKGNVEEINQPKPVVETASSTLSYRKALLDHLLLGRGLFYVDPKARRRWIYPFLELAILFSFLIGAFYNSSVALENFWRSITTAFVVLYTTSFFDLLLTLNVIKNDLSGNPGLAAAAWWPLIVMVSMTLGHVYIFGDFGYIYTLVVFPIYVLAFLLWWISGRKNSIPSPWRLFLTFSFSYSIISVASFVFSAEVGGLDSFFEIFKNEQYKNIIAWALLLQFCLPFLNSITYVALIRRFGTQNYLATSLQAMILGSLVGTAVELGKGGLVDLTMPLFIFAIFEAFFIYRTRLTMRSKVDLISIVLISMIIPLSLFLTGKINFELTYWGILTGIITMVVGYSILWFISAKFSPEKHDN